VLGVLTLGHPQPGRFGRADLDYLARYAEYATVAVVNAELHAARLQSEAEQRWQRLELAVLLQVGEAVNRSLDLDTILHEGLQALDELRLIGAAGIYLVDRQRATLDLRASRNLPADLAAHFMHLSVEQLLFGSAVAQACHLVLDTDQIARLKQIYPQLAAIDLTSVGVVPLIVEGQTLGALVVNRSDGRAYDAHDLRLLDGIASQLAQAVANAQHHQQLEETAAASARLYREAEGIRNYLNSLIRHTPDLLLTVSQNMALHVLNPERLTALGYGDKQIEGRSLLDIVLAHRQHELLASWRKIVSGQPQLLETELLGAAGAPLIVMLSAALIPEYGEVFVIVKNVTEQRRLEAQLYQSEKLAALGRLVAGAAHELNNPLAAILGLTQLQVLDELPPMLRLDIENIERAALRASQIVQHLRLFARPLPRELRALDIARLVRQALERLEADLAAHSVQVALDLPASLPQVVADALQLEQVVLNVIQNAFLAVAQNPTGAPRTLTISGQAVGGGMRLAIGDSGPGIAPEHMSRIFDPFFTTRRVGEGTGLGLSIVHAIVQRHGGRIWA
jgi:PAS domain S-box-containing protein